MTPPEGASSTTSYAPDGSWIGISTQGSSATSYVDGFGRPTLVENSEGVKVSTTYDQEGRKTFSARGSDAHDMVDCVMDVICLKDQGPDALSHQEMRDEVGNVARNPRRTSPRGD